jgi:transketolase C-terminal domain/subunit
VADLYAEFGKAVEAALQSDDRVIVVTCDTARDHCVYGLEKKYPGRVVEVGICESHAVSFASGLALQGFKPIVVTYARFLLRAYEQIYNQTTEHTAVVYVGGLAGPLPASGPGESHEARDDAGAFEGLGIPVYQPWDGESVGAFLRKALRWDRPSYVRLRHVI